LRMGESQRMSSPIGYDGTALSEDDPCDGDRDRLSAEYVFV